MFVIVSLMEVLLVGRDGLEKDGLVHHTVLSLLFGGGKLYYDRASLV